MLGPHNSKVITTTRKPSRSSQEPRKRRITANSCSYVRVTDTEIWIKSRKRGVLILTLRKKPINRILSQEFYEAAERGFQFFVQHRLATHTLTQWRCAKHINMPSITHPPFLPSSGHHCLPPSLQLPTASCDSVTSKTGDKDSVPPCGEKSDNCKSICLGQHAMLHVHVPVHACICVLLCIDLCITCTSTY